MVTIDTLARLDEHSYPQASPAVKWTTCNAADLNWADVFDKISIYN